MKLLSGIANWYLKKTSSKNVGKTRKITDKSDDNFNIINGKFKVVPSVESSLNTLKGYEMELQSQLDKDDQMNCEAQKAVNEVRTGYANPIQYKNF